MMSESNAYPRPPVVTAPSLIPGAGSFGSTLTKSSPYGYIGLTLLMAAMILLLIYIGGVVI